MPLPEKRFFPLDEIIERWDKHGVDFETLLDYARQDLLVFAVYMPGVWTHRTVTEPGRHVRAARASDVLKLGRHASRNLRFPVWYLTGEDAVGVLSAGPGQQVPVQKFYRRHDRTAKSGVFHGQPRNLIPSNIVVTKTERDRFELKHELNVTVETSEAALARVLKIARRFPEAVHALNHRYAQRDKQVDMADEYDMQDFMGALLAIDFTDIRPEETVPSVAGRRTRIDFVLAKEGIGVELKMTRPGATAKTVGDELTQDIERYQAHPRCQTLVCVVYDPERRIRNAAELEELSGPRQRCKVAVLVVR